MCKNAQCVEEILKITFARFCFAQNFAICPNLSLPSPLIRSLFSRKQFVTFRIQYILLTSFLNLITVQNWEHPRICFSFMVENMKPWLCLPWRYKAGIDVNSFLIFWMGNGEMRRYNREPRASFDTRKSIQINTDFFL